MTILRGGEATSLLKDPKQPHEIFQYYGEAYSNFLVSLKEKQ